MVLHEVLLPSIRPTILILEVSFWADLDSLKACAGLITFVTCQTVV